MIQIVCQSDKLPLPGQEDFRHGERPAPPHEAICRCPEGQRLRRRLLGWRSDRVRCPGKAIGAEILRRPDPCRRQAALVHHRGTQPVEPRRGAWTGASDPGRRQERDRPRESRSRRKAEPVMAGLCSRFLVEYVRVHCKPSTQTEYRRSVKLFIDPVIGELQVAAVERKDIAVLHHGLRDKPYQANRTLGVLSKMFNLAEVWGWRRNGSKPCRHVKRYKEHQRERFLSTEETARLGEILREAEVEMLSAVSAFRLLLLTGCRMSEIRDLRWEYVKEDCLELPDTKTGGRVVPLGPEARAVLSSIPRDGATRGSSPESSPVRI